MNVFDVYALISFVEQKITGISTSLSASLRLRLRLRPVPCPGACVGVACILCRVHGVIVCLISS